MNGIKTITAAATFVSVLSAANMAYAIDEYNVSKGTTLSGTGVALRGDDAVALATGLEVTPGDATITYDYDGVAYYFASKETMKQFASSPESYMPQFGGYCAFGVAVGKKLDADPRLADIVDGKLYVFLNTVAFEKYLEDKAGTLAKAERNWPAMHHVSVPAVNGA